MNRAWIAMCAAVAIVALMDLWTVVRPAPTPVPADVMKKAADEVRGLQKSGDHVVHSPLFTVRELAPLDHLRARPDRPSAAIANTRRVIAIDRSDWPMFGLGTPSEERTISDDVVVRVYEPQGGGGEASLYHLLSAFDENTLHIERPPGTMTSRCTATRAEGGFGCPGEPEWLYVANRSLRIGGQQRNCLWAHPTTGGAVVFNIPKQPAPPPGRALRLEVNAGFTDDAVRGTPGGATVTIAIHQKGRRLGALPVRNTVGWFDREADIEPDEAVQLRITTSRDGRRHLCIDAKVKEIGKP